MPPDQKDLLKLATKLGTMERQVLRASRDLEDLKSKADKVRDLIFANLAATGTPEERQSELVRLLALATGKRELQVNQPKRQRKLPIAG